MQSNFEIWIISHFSGSAKHGMVFRPYYLSRHFIEKGENVRIFASSFSHVRNLNPEPDSLFSHENIDGIDYHWLKTFSYKPSNFVLRMLSQIYFCFLLLGFPTRVLGRPKVVIASSPSLLPVINAWLWAKLFRAKFIFEVRDLWPESLVQLGGLSRWHPVVVFFKLFERFAYRYCDHCVTVLPNAETYFLKNGLAKQKLRVIPNGIVVEDTREALKEHNQFPKDKFLVGFVGAIGKANNLGYLLDIAKLTKDPNVHYIILGSGEEKASLMRRCISENIENLSFYDSVPKNQVRQQIDQFDLCFISLVYKPLFHYGVSPNKLFDYMLAGKPILYCVDSGNSPVLDASCGVEIKTYNPELAMKAVLELKSKPEGELKEIGAKAKKYVLANHDYKFLGDKFLEVIHE